MILFVCRFLLFLFTFEFEPTKVKLCDDALIFACEPRQYVLLKMGPGSSGAGSASIYMMRHPCLEHLKDKSSQDMKKIKGIHMMATVYVYNKSKLAELVFFVKIVPFQEIRWLYDMLSAGVCHRSLARMCVLWFPAGDWNNLNYGSETNGLGNI